MNVKKSTKKTNEMKNIKVTSVEVSNVRTFDWKDDTLVFFTLTLNGVIIHDVQIRTSHEGKDFVSFPTHKAKDGKYYNTVYARLSDEDSAQIIEAVQNALN